MGGLLISLGVLGAAAAGLAVRAILRPGGTPANTPNILLVTFDTTRADRIGVYGWRHGRTPAVDKLAAQGVRFTHAFASGPVTLPSHTTMMTGLYPFQHGVRDNIGFELDEGARTLAEVLREHGYQTGAVVAAFVLDSRFGLDQGFDEYRDDLPGHAEFARFQVPERNAEKVVDDAIDWLQHTNGTRPFFLWCHFYDPHHPYHTPETFPFYLSHPYDLEVAFADFHFQRLLDHLEQTPPNQRSTVIVMTGDHGEGLGEHGEETHAYFVYDSTLHVPLVIKLPDESNAGVTIDTPVSLTDIMPTALELAGLPVPEEDEIHGRSLVGVLKGERAALEAFEKRPIYFESYTPAYSFGWAPVRGIRVDGCKYIDSPEAELYLLAENPREGRRHNVHQQHPDLVAELTSAMHNFLNAPLRTQPLSGEMESTEPEVLEKLRALGYVGGTVIETPQWNPEDDLKKRLPLYRAISSASAEISDGNVVTGTSILLNILQVDRDNLRGLWLLAEAVATNPVEAAEGLPVIEAACRNPGFDAAQRAAFLTNCGRAYLGKEDPRRALAFFQQALEVEPGNPTLLDWISTTYLYLGRVSEAVEPARRAAEQAPNMHQLRVFLGLVLFCNEQFEEGAQQWHGLLAGRNAQSTVWYIGALCARDSTITAMAHDPVSRAAADLSLPRPVRAALHATNGQVLYNRGQHGAALIALEAACSLLEPVDVLGLWWRSRTLVSLERIEEARELLEQAYEQDHDQILVVADLAMIWYELGDTAKADRLLSRYYEAHPENPTAANNLAWMLAETAQQGPDLERALDLAKFAVKRRPSSASFTDTLGWVHLKRGDAESAIFAFSRAARLQPSGASHHYHLGLAYRLDGQLDQAQEAFTAAVELAPTPRPKWFQEAMQGSAPHSPP